MSAKNNLLLLAFLVIITGCAASDPVFGDEEFRGWPGKVVLTIFDANIWRGFGFAPGLHLSVRSAFATSSLTGTAHAEDQTHLIYLRLSPGNNGGVSQAKSISNDPKSVSPNTASISVSSYDERNRLYSLTTINDFPSAERIRLLTTHPCRDLTYTGFVNENHDFALGQLAFRSC